MFVRDDFLYFFLEFFFIYFLCVSRIKKEKIHALGDGCLYSNYIDTYDKICQQMFLKKIF